MLKLDAIFEIRFAPRKLRRRCKRTYADRLEDETKPENTVPLCLFLLGSVDVYVHTMLERRWRPTMSYPSSSITQIFPRKRNRYILIMCRARICQDPSVPVCKLLEHCDGEL